MYAAGMRSADSGGNRASVSVGRAGSRDAPVQRGLSGRRRTRASSGGLSGCWSWSGNVRVTVIGELGPCYDGRVGESVVNVSVGSGEGWD